MSVAKSPEYWFGVLEEEKLKEASDCLFGVSGRYINFQASLHILCVRETVEMVKVEREKLAEGDWVWTRVGFSGGTRHKLRSNDFFYRIELLTLSLVPFCFIT